MWETRGKNETRHKVVKILHKVFAHTALFTRAIMRLGLIYIQTEYIVAVDRNFVVAIRVNDLNDVVVVVSVYDTLYTFIIVIDVSKMTPCFLALLH